MRKERFLNNLITILSTLVVVCGTLLAYELLTREQYSVSFNLNGTSGIDKNNIKCELSIKGCIVTIPNATSTDGEFIGYNFSNDDTFAVYKAGDKVLLDDNMTLYAIAYKKNTVKIDTSDIDFIENKEVSCNSYNNNSCKVKLPLFNKVGYNNVGYSTSSKNTKYAMIEYLHNEEYEISSNVTIYPQYEIKSNLGDKYNTNYIGIIGNNFIEFDKTGSSGTLDMYKRYLTEINKNAPYLFTAVKINILSENTFNSYWRNSNRVLGLTNCYYGDNNPTKLNTIDIKYDFSLYARDGYSIEKQKASYYATLIHEMAHAWDSYYPFALKGVVPKNISSSNEQIHNTNNYFSDYSLGRISNHQDVANLYVKYKSQKSNRPISDYAYTSKEEFWAEIVAYYYLKYIVPTGEFISANYPDDIKQVVEKYICIAKNNYRNNGCY